MQETLIFYKCIAVIANAVKNKSSCHVIILSSKKMPTPNSISSVKATFRVEINRNKEDSMQPKENCSSNSNK